MAFGNGKQNNNNTEKSVNTRGPQFYNRDKERGATLILGFWNNFQTIKICPILPESKRSESKMYNYETFLTSTLTPEKTLAFLQAIKRHVLPAVESGDLQSMQAVGIPVGSGFIQISNGLTLGYPAGLYVTIYSKVDESGKAEQWLSYEFGKTPSFLNYNHENGDIDKETADIEFDLFRLYLEEGVKASTRAIAHSVRDSYKYIDDARRNNLQSIMEKMGIETGGYSKGNNGGGGKQSGFFGNGGGNNGGGDKNYKIASNEGSGLNDQDIEYKDASQYERLPI